MRTTMTPSTRLTQATRATAAPLTPRVPAAIALLASAVLGALAACGGDDDVSDDTTGDAAPDAASSGLVADAGPDLGAVAGVTRVTLDASGSTVPAGVDATFAWTFTSVPAGSAAVGRTLAGEVAEFVPDVDGMYELTLSVSDGTTAVTDEVVVGVSGATAIRAVGGPLVAVPVATPLGDALEVEVVNAHGLPISGAAVEISVTSGNGTFLDPSDSTGQVTTTARHTDPSGRTRIYLTAGTIAGANTVTATCAACTEVQSVELTVIGLADAAAVIRLLPPVNVQVPGPMTVEVAMFDRYGNRATGEATFTLTTSGDAAFAAVATNGTLVNGGLTGTIDATTDASGVFEIALNDTSSEQVHFLLLGATLPADASDPSAAPVVITPPTIPHDMNALCYEPFDPIVFAAPLPPGSDATLAVTLEGDFGSTVEYVTASFGGIAVEDTTEGASLTGNDCEAVVDTIDVPASTLAADAADGAFELVLTPSAAVDCFCGSYQASVTLTYQPAISAFLPALTTRLAGHPQFVRPRCSSSAPYRCCFLCRVAPGEGALASGLR